MSDPTASEQTATTNTAPKSDAGRYAVYWREIDSDLDDIHLAHVHIIEGYSTLADIAKIIAIRHLPIGRMNAERVVIIATSKIENGDAMTTPSPVRRDDRITVLAGRARSASTNKTLIRPCTLDVLSARVEADGEIKVYGLLLTASGAWRQGAPTRTVILPVGSYTTPVRVGDTVRSRRTDETFTVTAIHVPPDGTANVDALFTTGATGSGYSLADLDHVARPATEPTSRPCKRRHPAGVACVLCVEATTPVTTACRATGCTNAATNLLLVSRPSAGSDVTALCPDSTERFKASHPNKAITLVPLAAGTHGFLDDGHGTQVATCRHCCHRIYLYPALLHRDRPWRAHQFDETGRCTAHIESLAQQPIPHEPATTRGELDDARATALCEDPERHLPDECPVHQQ